MKPIIKIEKITATVEINGYLYTLAKAGTVKITDVPILIRKDLPVKEGMLINPTRQSLTLVPEAYRQGSKDFAIRIDDFNNVEENESISEQWEITCRGLFLPSDKGYPVKKGPTKKLFYASTLCCYTEYSIPFRILAVAWCSKARLLAEYSHPVRCSVSASLLREVRDNSLMLNIFKFQEEL